VAELCLLAAAKGRGEPGARVCCPCALTPALPAAASACSYKYFIFVNSSVRGPFLPNHLRGKIHWTTPFITWGPVMMQQAAS
jgi:hypothetical protein